MNKEYILKLEQYTISRIIEFGEKYKNENIIETSYINWNARDVIGHINCWVDYYKNKLVSIKTNKLFKDIEHNDIEIFNKANYEKYKIKTLFENINEAKILFKDYENVINLYSEDELLSKEFPIEIIDDVYSSSEFSCALWEYIALDLFIHPINHIFYQYIKNNNYNEFINEIEKSKNYSNNNIKIYKLSNLFENKEIKEKHFTALLNIIKNKNNKFIEEIIKINMM